MVVCRYFVFALLFSLFVCGVVFVVVFACVFLFVFVVVVDIVGVVCFVVCDDMLLCRMLSLFGSVWCGLVYFDLNSG